MKKRVSEWVRARKVLLSVLSTVTLVLGGGTAAVVQSASASSDVQAEQLQQNVEDCQARVGALEQAIAANQADHGAILRALTELHADVREMRSTMLRGGGR